MNDGGPAFPSDTGRMGCMGLSIRDWFAGMALQGMIAGRWLSNKEPGEWAEDFATQAYAIASVMLKQKQVQQDG